jgi:hypothetical protein
MEKSELDEIKPQLKEAGSIRSRQRLRGSYGIAREKRLAKQADCKALRYAWRQVSKRIFFQNASHDERKQELRQEAKELMTRR